MNCRSFFFSSRRRHTRCSRDWSSDVCSSDLIEQVEGPNQPAGFKPESHLVRVGDKTQVYGLTLDEAVLGKKKGEAIEVSQEGTGAVRGTVQTIKQKVLPELDDEFAKDLGDYRTLAELREKVRTQLEQSLKRDIEETYKDQIMKRLVDLHRSEEHTSELQSRLHLVCRLLLEK